MEGIKYRGERIALAKREGAHEEKTERGTERVGCVETEKRQADLATDFWDLVHH